MPLEPVHDHAVALLELALSVTVPPLHIVPLFVAPVEDGTGLTVTDVVYTVAGEQPLPVLLTVSEYVVVAVGLITGFCALDVVPLEPVHDHAVALLELALSVTVPPLQIVPLFVAPVEDGTGLTVTVVRYTVPGLQPLPTLLTVKA